MFNTIVFGNKLLKDLFNIREKKQLAQNDGSWKADARSKAGVDSAKDVDLYAEQERLYSYPARQVRFFFPCLFTVR